MSILSDEQRSALLQLTKSLPNYKLFTLKETRLAINCVSDIFSNFEQVFIKHDSYVVIRSGKLQLPTSFINELVPSILQANRYFNYSIPKGLKKKLTNPLQTHNTIFELICLGIFQQLHKVQYEPKLSSGKVPDLSIKVETNLIVYIECKSQGFLGTTHHNQFSTAARNVHQAFKDTSLMEWASKNEYRVEVYLKKFPSQNDLDELYNFIHNEPLIKDQNYFECTESINVGLVKRDLGFRTDLSSPSQHKTIGSKAVKLGHSTTDLAIYPWLGLTMARVRSQKRLLKSARIKLRKLPENSYGMICMKTYGTKEFKPSVHKLIDQPEYERIPIVWLNPDSRENSIVISREGFLAFRKKVLFI